MQRRCRVYWSTHRLSQEVAPKQHRRTWPVVFPQPAHAVIPVHGSSDAGTPIESYSPMSAAADVVQEQSTAPPTAANTAHVHAPNAVPYGQAPAQHEKLPASHAATGASEEAFSIKVQSCEEIGEDYVWTLSLKGFEKKQIMYIYHKGSKLKGSVGYEIVDLAEQKVRAKASLFDLCESGECEFR